MDTPVRIGKKKRFKILIVNPSPYFNICQHKYFLHINHYTLENNLVSMCPNPPNNSNPHTFLDFVTITGQLKEVKLIKVYTSFVMIGRGSS